MLTLTQSLTLIAYDPQGHLLAQSTNFTPLSRLNECLANLALFELSELGRIRYGDKIEVANPTPTGNTVLDRVLETVRKSPWKRHETDWIIQLASFLHNRLSDLSIEQLIQMGCLRREQKHVLGVFSTDLYPAADATEENAMKAHLRQVVRGELSMDSRTRNLLAMVHFGHLEGAIFPEQEKGETRLRIEALMANRQP